MIGAVKSAVVARGDGKFIQRWLPGRSFFSLEERLRVLADSIGILAIWEMKPKEIAALRNDVAHGKKALNPREVDTAYRQMLDLASG